MLLFVLALSAAVLVLDERRAVMNLAIGKTWLRVQPTQHGRKGRHRHG